jgi:hypothetical protein
LHLKSHVVPSQVATAFGGGGGHTSQLDPQVNNEVSSAQVPPQAWKPRPQEIPQDPATHVATPCAGDAQDTQATPHADTDESSAHVAPQRW